MKISEKIINAYNHGMKFRQPICQRVLADALQQAVAENLELKEKIKWKEYEVQHLIGNSVPVPGPVTPKDQELLMAEADKILRGEK